MWITHGKTFKGIHGCYWETIDILVSTMLLQDPQVAADNYKEALTKGTLMIPRKLPKAIVPYGRAVQIKSHMFRYYNIKNWNTPYITDRNWMNTQAVAWQPSNFTSMLVKQLFDAQAQYFGLHMFNLPKCVDNPDIIGALSHGLDTITISGAQKFMQPKYLVDKDLNLLDIEAQERHRCVRQTPHKWRVQMATVIAGPYDAKLLPQPQGVHCTVTHAYSQLHD